MAGYGELCMCFWPINALYWINVIVIGQVLTVDIIGFVGKLVGRIQKHRLL